MNTGHEIWIARCKAGPGQSETPTAAVWAASEETCERTLRSKVIERGLEWVGLETARPLKELAADERADLPIEGLDETLGPETPVVFRRGQFRKRMTGAHNVTPLPFSEPLDMQIGAMKRLNVPEDLEPHLFPNDRKTYAVLDAGQFLDLRGTLNSSGLRHQCLYTGKMADEMGHLAPYLVALGKEARLTRQLFTDGQGPNDFWRKDYGVFALSDLDFDTLYSHFRKFTSVEDETRENRLYFRFWSVAVLRAFAHHTAPDPLISNLLAPCTLVFRDLHRTEGPAVLALAQERPE